MLGYLFAFVFAVLAMAFGAIAFGAYGWHHEALTRAKSFGVGYFGDEARKSALEILTKAHIAVACSVLCVVLCAASLIVTRQLIH